MGLSSAFNVLDLVTVILIFEDRLNIEKTKHKSCLQRQLK